MTDSDISALIIGAFLPWLIQVIVQQTWSDRLKQIVAGVVYVIVSFVVWLYRNSWEADGGWRGYVRVLAPIIIGAVVAFVGLWRHTVLPPIAKATEVDDTSRAALPG